MIRVRTFVLHLLAASAALLVLGSAGPSVGPAAEPSAVQLPKVLPGPVDIVWADPRNFMFQTGPTAEERLASPAAFTSNITVTYDAGFASVPQAQGAFQAAVDIWRSVITSPVIIRVNASYRDLGNPNILGSAGPTFICLSSNGQANTYYAAALADKLAGTGAHCSLSAFEINANFNSTFSNWDFGTTGVPVSGKYNFLTVVLHELGHGLGHYGSMSVSGGMGSYRSTPDIYDRFAVTGAGAPLLGFASPSAELAAQLVSNNTFFNGPYARSQNGNANAKLDTHNFGGTNGGWQQGSSYSHIDDALYTGTANGLMTWALGQAEVYTDPGPIVRGIFADEGWGVSTLGSNPIGALNTPTSGANLGASFPVAGWAIDLNSTSGTGIDQVHVYAYPSGGGAPIALGVASYGGSRPDVGTAYGAQFTNSGFSLNAAGLANGSYTLNVFGRSTITGSFSVLVSIPITVSGPVPQPAIALGAPLSNSTSGSTVTTNGWAIDRGAPSGTGVDQVHVYAFPSGGGSPIALGVATYGLSRPDVGAIYGAQFNNSGFSLQAVVAPGNYTIVAYMHSTVSGTFNAAASSANVTVNSTNSNPQMLLDGPPNGAVRARPFVISGWAVDTGAASGTGIDAIHIWAFPVSGGPQFFVGVGTYGTSRPDVGTYLGDTRYNNSGFTFTATTGNVPSPGTYDFQIFGRSTVTGSFTVARVVRVTVQ